MSSETLKTIYTEVLVSGGLISKFLNLPQIQVNYIFGLAKTWLELKFHFESLDPGRREMSQSLLG